MSTCLSYSTGCILASPLSKRTPSPSPLQIGIACVALSIAFVLFDGTLFAWHPALMVRSRDCMAYLIPYASRHPSAPSGSQRDRCPQGLLVKVKGQHVELHAILRVHVAHTASLCPGHQHHPCIRAVYDKSPLLLLPCTLQRCASASSVRQRPAVSTLDNPLPTEHRLHRRHG